MKTFNDVFYGWWIAIAAMTVLSVGAGVYWQGFGVFFLPLAHEFSTSRAALSGVVSISQLEGGLLGPVGGYLVDRYGPRKMMLIGGSFMGLGFLLLSQVQSLMMFYVVFLLVISVGMSIGIRVPALVAPVNWFIKKRGRALGIATSGGGLGGVFVPFLGWLIVAVGWRTTAVIAGLMVWVVALPLAFFMRTRPEDYGLLPDGERSVSQNVETSENGLEDTISGEAEYTLMQALKTPAFWFLAIVLGLRQLAIGAIALHQVPFLVGIGIRTEIAATVLGMTGVISILGRFGFGWLAEKISTRYVMAITMGLVALGSFVLANVGTWWHLFFFVPIYAVGWGGGATLMFALRAEYFGRKAFGTISGAMDAIQMFGLVLGPVFAGLVYDLTESYYPAFITFAISAALAALTMVFIRPPERRNG
ncbi:MAG: MFS transporter [SAR202 cluster bacterium]|mgnify:CR=1 FL=1|nr:MFS transporter [SAR202 cluster bacterium]|tara:strand:+ start:6187 stop:7443 length:1257 start_codon:yes stop_codon:yes gene_type:complete